MTEGIHIGEIIVLLGKKTNTDRAATARCLEKRNRFTTYSDDVEFEVILFHLS